MSRSVVWLGVLLWFSTAALGVEERVLRVIDGDTLIVLQPPNAWVYIRLAEIDAPEHNQPYGTEARDALIALVGYGNVRIVETAHDRYGRTVARLYVGRTDVSAALVRQGCAWVYRQYAHDPTLYIAEEEARRARRGLWAEDHPIPPWEWRTRQRNHSR